jgi:hypothetical protein
MDQRNSIFMPGLTRRGPVINALGKLKHRGPYFSGLGDLPALPPLLKYGAMAALVYLGLTKKVPLLMAGGAAIAVWQVFPDAPAAIQGSGAPSAQDISVTTAGAATIPAPDLSNIPIPNVSIPALSGYFISPAPKLNPRAFI